MVKKSPTNWVPLDDGHRPCNSRTALEAAPESRPLFPVRPPQLRHLTSCVEGTQPDPEPTTSPPLCAECPFFVTTDDRRAFRWLLMLSDLRAIVEQQVLVHSGLFHGCGLISLAGSVVNMRVASTG
jgi:hypothetical protein